MNSQRTRLLLWSGCLAGVVFFVGDMLLGGAWGSGRSVTPERLFNVMARATAWRLHLGAFTGPVGIWFELIGMLGVWYCCRLAAPRSAAVMLLALYTFEIFGISPHGKFAAVGFSLRYCGADGAAIDHILLLNRVMTAIAYTFLLIGLGIWIVLTLKKQTAVPRWTIFFCPLITIGLEYVLVYMPAPLGFPLMVGWKSISFAFFFAVLALNYDKSESQNLPEGTI